METNKKNSAICVLTARGIETILADGGSKAWVLDVKRARGCQYVICVQNHGVDEDWAKVSAAHHTAFLVGKLKTVVRSEGDGTEKRWCLVFSEYAEIDIPNAWPGHRNPVLYTDLEEFGIDVDTLEFHSMPEQEQVPDVQPSVGRLTIAEAKKGLAETFGVEPSNIEITVRC